MSPKPLAVLIATLLSACGGETSAPQSPILHATTAKSAPRAQLVAPVVKTETFGGARADYTIANVNNVFTVTSKQGGAAIQISAATERIKFADGTLVLDIDGYAGTVYRVYQAAFDRKPDMPGYAFWLSVADSGESVESIAAGFVSSGEFQALYGSKPSNNDLLMRYYRKVLHRAPDAGGFNFWLNAPNGGAATPVQILAQFSDRDENKAQVLADIQNGIWLPGNGKLGVTFGSGSSALAVGQIHVLDITGVATSGVEVRIGGIKIPVAISEGKVVFAVPEMAAGTKTVVVSAGGQNVEMSVTVSQTVLLQTPALFLSNFIAEVDAKLATAILSSTGSQKLQFEQMRVELQKQKLALSSMPDAQLRANAYLVMANFWQLKTVAMSALRAEGASLECASDATKAVLYNVPL